MLIKVVESGSKLQDDRINVLEELIGVQIPIDYKKFLLNHNGGIPEPGFFQIFGSEARWHVRSFLGLDLPIKSSNIDWNWNSLKGRIPKHLLPIADDDMGNFVLMSFVGFNRGKILFWIHDQETSFDSLESLHDVNASFDEFIESLHDYDIEDEIRAALGSNYQPKQ